MACAPTGTYARFDISPTMPGAALCLDEADHMGPELLRARRDGEGGLHNLARRRQASLPGMDPGGEARDEKPDEHARPRTACPVPRRLHSGAGGAGLSARGCRRPRAVDGPPKRLA